MYLFTIANNNNMAGIDDDLMDEIIPPIEQEEQNKELSVNQPKERRPSRKRKNGIEIVFRVINYCVDASMLLLSIIMMGGNDKSCYPLLFCFGLILWMGYRMLSFKRNKVVDVLLGFFLIVMAVIFYLVAYESYEPYGCVPYGCHENVGYIMIPTVYLGYFCAWGAIRRKKNVVDSND